MHLEVIIWHCVKKANGIHHPKCIGAYLKKHSKFMLIVNLWYLIRFFLSVKLKYGIELRLVMPYLRASIPP